MPENSIRIRATYFPSGQRPVCIDGTLIIACVASLPDERALTLGPALEFSDKTWCVCLLKLKESCQPAVIERYDLSTNIVGGEANR
jgi:hypothetical protein